MAVFEQLGFDQPLYVQFWTYLTQIFSGDFGVALLTGHRVVDDIIRVFPATVELATVSHHHRRRPRHSARRARRRPPRAAVGPCHPGGHAARPLGADLLDRA